MYSDCHFHIVNHCALQKLEQFHTIYRRSQFCVKYILTELLLWVRSQTALLGMMHQPITQQWS